MGRLLWYALPMAVALAAAWAAAAMAGAAGVDLDRAIASAVEETLFAAIPIGILQNIVHAYTGVRSAFSASGYRQGGKGASPTIVVGANPKSGKVRPVTDQVDAVTSHDERLFSALHCPHSRLRHRTTRAGVVHEAWRRRSAL